MRRGSLNSRAGSLDRAKKDIGAAIRYAEASGQLDVLWRARIIGAPVLSSASERDAICQTALYFALRTGMHRVAVEALMLQAATAIAAKIRWLILPQTR